MSEQFLSTSEKEVQLYYLAARLKRAFYLIGFDLAMGFIAVEGLARLAENLVQQYRSMAISAATDFLESTQKDPTSVSKEIRDLSLIVYNHRRRTDDFGKAVVADVLHEHMQVDRSRLGYSVALSIVAPTALSQVVGMASLGALDAVVSPFLRQQHLLSPGMARGIAQHSSAAVVGSNNMPSASLNGCIEIDQFVMSMWWPRMYWFAYWHLPRYQPANKLINTPEAKKELTQLFYNRENCTVQDIVVLRTIWNLAGIFVSEVREAVTYVARRLQGKLGDETRSAGRTCVDRVRNVWLPSGIKWAARQGILAGCTWVLAHESVLAMNPYTASIWSYWVVDYGVLRSTGLL